MYVRHVCSPSSYCPGRLPLVSSPLADVLALGNEGVEVMTRLEGIVPMDRRCFRLSGEMLRSLFPILLYHACFLLRTELWCSMSFLTLDKTST